MSSELIVNASLPEIRIALTEDGEVQELLIERASGKGIVGNIYKGKVTRVLPGMQAAFVDIGLEKAAFLYVDDVYVHSQIFEGEEGAPQKSAEEEIAAAEAADQAADQAIDQEPEPSSSHESNEGGTQGNPDQTPENSSETANTETRESEIQDQETYGSETEEPLDSEGDDEEEPQTETPEDPENPTSMSTKPGDSDSKDTSTPVVSEGRSAAGPSDRKRRFKRGRHSGRGKNFKRAKPRPKLPDENLEAQNTQLPDSYHSQVADSGEVQADRAALDQSSTPPNPDSHAEENRPDTLGSASPTPEHYSQSPQQQHHRQEFRSFRSRDRRIRPKSTNRPSRGPIGIDALLKEGQEVLVQVAKDPIAAKGARLTCHISLPGRHLVCMPTIDHVGVSRRIDRDDERRKLRDFVERNRPKGLGFIVRTASSKHNVEEPLRQDMEYLAHLWDTIQQKATSVPAPSLVYEDLNPVLRAIRDWVTDDLDKIIVDSRYHYNDIMSFISYFMPSLKPKVELYHGDIPLFDAYGISAELSRALERKVWLKSGGYIVIDQSEALVAIDVNTGRYVGKKNLEETILKTNLEAAREIAYQLRLRNCGGIIIIDFIDMERMDNRQRVYRAFEEALRKDRARPSIMKISDLGLVEMTRKRTRDTMVRALCESCSHCEGKGFIKSRQTVAYEILRELEREGISRNMQKVLIQAHPEVIDILAIEERETLDQLERRYRRQYYLQGVDDFHYEQFEVNSEGKQSEQQAHAQNRDRDRDRYRQRQHRHPHGRQAPQIVPQIIPQIVPKITIQPVQQAPTGDQPAQEGDSPQQEGQAYSPQQEGQPDSPQQADQSYSPQQAGQPYSPQQAGQPYSPQQAGQPYSPQQAGQPYSPQQVSQPTDPQNGQPQRNSENDPMDEEDRLAFLRAQAAQDAALAHWGGPNGGQQQTPQRQPNNFGRQSRPHQQPGQGRRNNNNNYRNNRFSRNRRPGGGGGGGGGKYQGYRPGYNQTDQLNEPPLTITPVSAEPIKTPSVPDSSDSSNKGGGSDPSNNSGTPTIE